jgi:two-component system chemotaxis sensor kinase CheA
MSHELRTPLNSLLILAGELKANPDKNLTESQVQYATIIESSGTDLLKLLNDVLDLAKVESGTVTLENGELALAELRDALELEFGPVADQQGMAFSVELGSGIPPTVVTDSGRLRQVLKNLLANAFKFTERGEVTLRVSEPASGWSRESEELERAAKVTAFSISDTGIGIAPDLQKRIFESFAQADGTAARQYGGTGLGLSISRELVQLLGGEIALSSTPGEGSTFTVYLPSTRNGHASSIISPAARPEPARSAAGEAHGSMMTPQSEASVPAALAGLKVLVVDDDFRNIFAVTALLERGHVEVISAESGEEAIAVLQRRPDIGMVLVDIMMPVMDGYETVREMRNLPWEGSLAIIALTAKTGSGERERCIAAGASAYISKPVENGSRFLADLAEFVAVVAPAKPAPNVLN